ncbi:MAG: hypoxanthine phosphoribosyltransferase [Anaerolineales bacterium]|nr:hypoxanthine phosphoribosyltransferase [Anaerolineales bacterium]MCB8937068.1 hypoxanthine phosphoribosyltransferase [Ardenticatenaceae bacterium]
MSELHPDLARVLVPEETIQAHVKVLAHQISLDYADKGTVYLVGVLRGAFIFLADLVRHLTVPHVVDFMSVSSYGKSTVSGTVRIVLDLREPIDHKHVIIVEDIVDSGKTLSYLYNMLKSRNPASLRTCSLVQKPKESLDVPIDYLGFKIPDVWVVGYGLDYADQHRTLPYIAELNTAVYEK